MARRKGNGGGIGLIVIGGLIAAIASIPKELWIALGVFAAIGVVLWLVSALSNSSSTSESDSEISARSVSPEFTPQPDRVSVRNQLSRPKPLKDRGTPARWIPRDEVIEIAGTQVRGGLFYFGADLRSNNGEMDPALIDPRHSVDRSSVDLTLRQMNYWPSYSTISPSARRAYIDWLATGRSNPAADLGYVFLFFYGLERRALIDAETDPTAQSDLPLIEAEVRTLLSIYGSNRSFHKYATAFLSFLALRASDDSSNQLPPSVEDGDLSLPLRVGLGRIAASNLPLPVEWAFAWMRSDPRVPSSAALRRCPAEFEKLFAARYRAEFGDGIKLPMNRTKLRATYRPASGGFCGEIALPLGELPDITAVVAPLKKIERLVTECAESLAPYSRFVGKNPQSSPTLESLLLLPRILWPDATHDVMRSLDEKIGEGLRVMPLGELSSLLGASGSLTRERLRALAHALEELRIGIEPDILGGARTPKSDDQIILFRTEAEDSSLRDAPSYHAASVTLDLACTVAMTDGKVTADELRLLMKQIDSWSHLSGGQRKRLRARLRMAIDSPPSLASLKKRLENVPTDAKRAVAHLMSTLAQVDGTVTTSEVKLLEKIYKTLGIDAQATYSDLHAVAAAASGSVVVSEPSTETGSDEGFVLDPARIAALQRETAAVSMLLSSVFTDEVQPASEVAEERREAMATAEPGLLGLDPEHSVFLRLLITRTSWSRQDLADAAADMELMLDGALERINEAALDELGEALIEGEDPVEVLTQVLEKVPA